MNTEDERVAGATLKERTIGRGWELFEPIDAAFERGEIDQAEWHRRVGAIIGPVYLAAINPCAQSGSSSTPAGWEQARPPPREAAPLVAHPNKSGTVIVPIHVGRTIPPGTLKSIIDSIGLTIDEFRRLL